MNELDELVGASLLVFALITLFLNFFIGMALGDLREPRIINIEESEQASFWPAIITVSCMLAGAYVFVTISGLTRHLGLMGELFPWVTGFATSGSLMAAVLWSARKLS